MAFNPSYDVPVDRRPYQFNAGPVGCLMLHGYMGSPKSSRPLAEYLTSQGITVHCPLLPGHGHWPDKLHKISRRDWLAEVEEGLAILRSRCDEIYLLGHSMGAVLAGYLATRAEDINGVIMLAPLYEVPDKRLRWMGVIRFVMPWFYPHKSRSLQAVVRQRVLDFDPTLDIDDPQVKTKMLPQVSRVPTGSLNEMRKMAGWGRRIWSKVKAPALILQGSSDSHVSPDNARRIYELLSTEDKKLQYVPHGGHELMRPFDPTHRQVWQIIHEYIQGRSEHELSPPFSLST